jgi:hypothetical protein
MVELFSKVSETEKEIGDAATRKYEEFIKRLEEKFIVVSLKEVKKR